MGVTTKDIVRGFYESYNDGDLDATWERYVSVDLVNHAQGGAYDREAWREVDKAMFPAFADLRFQVLDQLQEGDKVATRFSISGTHTGDFHGIPPSGNSATMTITAIDIVADGKIAEHWAVMDRTAFRDQLTEPA
jgi:predicted ester cyclase